MDVPAFDYENPIDGNKDNVLATTLEYRFADNSPDYDLEYSFRITITDEDDDFYAGDTVAGNYKYDVTGLIKLADSEVVRTWELGGLRLFNVSGDEMVSADGDKFFIGHNGIDGLSRIWYGDSTASGGRVNLDFSVEELGLTEGSSYQLNSYDLSSHNNMGSSLVVAGSDYVRFSIGTGDKLLRLVEDDGNAQPLLMRTEFSLKGNLTSIGTLKVFDYETPEDANNDNMYEVIVIVDDGENFGNSVSSASIEVEVRDLGEHILPSIGGVFTAEDNKRNVFKLDDSKFTIPCIISRRGILRGMGWRCRGGWVEKLLFCCKL